MKVFLRDIQKPAEFHDADGGLGVKMPEAPILIMILICLRLGDPLEMIIMKILLKR
jgi:hypothetical protein